MAKFPSAAPLLYRLAHANLLHLGAGYTACITLALVLSDVERISPLTGLVELSGLGGIVAAIATSVLFTVVIWYRDDDLLEASVLLAVITGIGYLAGVGLASFIATGSPGTLIMLGAGMFFTLVVRVLIVAPVIASIVWVGRKLRRYFAPATVANDDSDASSRAA